LIPVPLIDLKFLSELAAVDAGASNRRHACGELEIPYHFAASPLRNFKFKNRTRIKGFLVLL
jgi:hypothetical protein